MSLPNLTEPDGLSHLRPIWSPADYWEAFEQAMAAPPCPATLTMYGESFNCDNTAPHTTHTSAALRARWVDTAVK
jgi:hypothetical protein